MQETGFADEDAPRIPLGQEGMFYNDAIILSEDAVKEVGTAEIRIPLSLMPRGETDMFLTPCIGWGSHHPLRWSLSFGKRSPQLLS